MHVSIKRNFGVSPLFVSILIYIFIALIYVYSFNVFVSLIRKNPQNVIIEGLLLPKTNFPLNTTFYVDPLLTNSNVDFIREIRKSITLLVFSSLFKENTDGSVTPDIVDKYEFNDSQNIILNIRKDIKWHDGASLDARDVLFTFNVLRSIGQVSFYYPAVNGNDIQIDLVDEYTIKITLAGSDGPKPNASYLHTLTFPVLPRHIIENYPKPSLNSLSETNFGKSPVGSGVLKYAKNKINELILTKNESYYRDPVSFDKYIFKFYKGYNELVKDYKLKNVHLVRRISSSTKDEDHSILLSAGMEYDDKVLRKRKLVLYFNLANGSDDASFFSKSALLRKGLLHVIDRSRIVEVLGNAKECFGPIDRDSWAFSPEVLEKQNLNIESFNNLATDLGFSKINGIYHKNDIPLQLTVSYLNGGIRTHIIEELKNQLKSAGVKLNPKPINDVEESSFLNNANSTESFYTVINNRNFDALLTFVDHYTDPDVFDQWHSTKITPPGLNLSGFSSKVADKTLEDGKINFGESRKTHYFRFQKTFFEEVPAIYLLYPSMLIYHSPKLKVVGKKEIPEEAYFYTDINKWEIK